MQGIFNGRVNVLEWYRQKYSKNKWMLEQEEILMKVVGCADNIVVGRLKNLNFYSNKILISLEVERRILKLVSDKSLLDLYIEKREDEIPEANQQYLAFFKWDNLKKRHFYLLRYSKALEIEIKNLLKRAAKLK